MLHKLFKVLRASKDIKCPQLGAQYLPALYVRLVRNPVSYLSKSRIFAHADLPVVTIVLLQLSSAKNIGPIHQVFQYCAFSHRKWAHQVTYCPAQHQIEIHNKNQIFIFSSFLPFCFFAQNKWQFGRHNSYCRVYIQNTRFRQAAQWTFSPCYCFLFAGNEYSYIEQNFHVSKWLAWSS